MSEQPVNRALSSQLQLGHHFSLDIFSVNINKSKMSAQEPSSLCIQTEAFLLPVLFLSSLCGQASSLLPFYPFLFLVFVFVCFVYFDRISLCSPGCSRTLFVDYTQR